MIIYDSIEKRSVVAAKIMRNAGYDAFAVSGGVDALTHALTEEK